MSHLFHLQQKARAQEKQRQFFSKRRSAVQKTLVVFLLIFSLFSIVGLSLWSTRKAEAAPSGEIYPAPTTLYTVPVPTNVARNWSTPYAITVGSNKNLWFTDFFDNLIGQATPGGAITEYPLSSGNDPTAITTGPDGNLWFLERYGAAYGYVTPSGSITEFPNGPYGVDPESLVTGPDGNLWAADYSGWIARITTAGTISDFPSAGINPSTIAVGSDGNLWYTAISVIGKMGTNGVGTSFPLHSGYSFPDGITAGPDGNLWFSEQGTSQNAVARITPNGVITDFPLPTVTFPDHTTWPVQASDLVPGPDGNLWFTANSAPLFGQITPGGAITYYLPANASSFGGTSPNSLVAGPDGNLWFADFAGHVGYLTLGGSSSTPTPVPQTPTPQPTSTPTPTLTEPSPGEYLQASNAAYGLDIGSLNIPVGMHEIDSSVSNTYAAIAFEDSNKNIIIANEGANIASPLGSATPYQNNSLLTYGEILKGITPSAFAAAVTFAHQVQMDVKQLSDANGKIYVTGHDLGGVEAEAQAQALASGIAGGATFGATGLPGNSATGGSLINYIDYGDTFGYWTSDAAGPLEPIAPAHMNHYGRVREVGNPYSAALVLFGANIDKELRTINDALNPMSYLADTFGNKQPLIKTAANLVVWTGLKRIQLNKRVTVALDVAEYSSLATGALLYHRISHYATDFSINLKPTVTPAITMEQYLKLYDPSATTAEIMDAQATTVNANGTLTSPKIDMSFNKQTGEMADQTYIDANHTTYDATFDATELVSSILVDENTGGSYRLYNDDFHTHPWSSYAKFYDGKNGTGKLIEILYNWHAGGSQVQLFTGLPHGVTKEIKDYSGPDGTGKLLRIQFK